MLTLHCACAKGNCAARLVFETPEIFSIYTGGEDESTHIFVLSFDLRNVLLTYLSSKCLILPNR